MRKTAGYRLFLIIQIVFSIGLSCFNLTAVAEENKTYRNYEHWVEDAEKGDLHAMNMLGNINKSGHINRAKSNVEAMRWYQKAADGGYGPAFFNVGLLYEKGGDGISINFSKAAKNYMQAVDAGFKGKAIERLNIVCENSYKDIKAVDCQKFGKYQAQERREAADRAEQYRRDAPARQARQMCEAQKQTCVASCPRWVNSGGYRTDLPEHSCQSRCESISCF